MRRLRNGRRILFIHPFSYHLQRCSSRERRGRGPALPGSYLPVVESKCQLPTPAKGADAASPTHPDLCRPPLQICPTVSAPRSPHPSLAVTFSVGHCDSLLLGAALLFSRSFLAVLPGEVGRGPGCGHTSSTLLYCTPPLCISRRPVLLCLLCVSV